MASTSLQTRMQRDATIGIGSGLLCSHALPWVMFALIDPDRMPSISAMALGVIAAGAVLTVWGGARLAQSNGHHPGWGAHGVFGIFGITVIACLPERVLRDQATRGFEVITIDQEIPG